MFRLKINGFSFRLLAIVSVIISLVSCQKVINVDLNTAAPKIVIEGVITNNPGPYSVTISKSVSYYNVSVPPPVTGAIVTISDNTGITDSLKESRPGIYVTRRITGKPGRTYTLRVISGNVLYSATSVMNSAVAIDSLGIVKNTSGVFESRKRPDFELHCYFRDPPQKNFYNIKVIQNDTLKTKFYRLYDDQYTNGEYTDLRVVNVQAGDFDVVELYSIDKATYEYYRTLDNVLFSNPVFGSTPANPASNLSNGALGYFTACAVSTKSININSILLDKIK